MIAGRMKDKKLINARGVMIISSMWFSSQLECSAVLPSPGTVEALNPSQRAPWHRGSLRLPCYEYDASIRQVRLLPMLWLLPISPRGQTPTMWIKCHLYLSSSTQYTCSNVKLENVILWNRLHLDILTIKYNPIVICDVEVQHIPRKSHF